MKKYKRISKYEMENDLPAREAAALRCWLCPSVFCSCDGMFSSFISSWCLHQRFGWWVKNSTDCGLVSTRTLCSYYPYWHLPSLCLMLAWSLSSFLFLSGPLVVPRFPPRLSPCVSFRLSLAVRHTCFSMWPVGRLQPVSLTGGASSVELSGTRASPGPPHSLQKPRGLTRRKVASMDTHVRTHS